MIASDRRFESASCEVRDARIASEVPRSNGELPVVSCAVCMIYTPLPHYAVDDCPSRTPVEAVPPSCVGAPPPSVDISSFPRPEVVM
jgi:hypothetical protein